MEHLGTIELDTKRLILRRFRIEDAENMFKNWAHDDEVTKYLTWPSHQDISVSNNFIKKRKKNYEKNDFYDWEII
jgi:ribosomal-protein-alanine N-acetyltransferase